VTNASSDQPIRETIEQAYKIFAEFEYPLIERLVQYLLTKPDITILGSQSTINRLPTISFISSRLTSSKIVKHLQTHKVACRNGHMYAHRLITALGIDIDDAVVRLSAVHYNTMAEIEQCIQVLDTILSYPDNDITTNRPN
jgi:selenocysteine lyase/cysteine desulfurase